MSQSRQSRSRPQSPASTSPVAAVLSNVWGAIAALFAVGFCINALQLTASLYMLQVYDRVLSSQSEATLLAITALAIALVGVYALLEACRSVTLIGLGSIIDRAVAADVFNGLFRTAALQGTGKLTAQPLRDLEQVAECGDCFLGCGHDDRLDLGMGGVERLLGPSQDVRKLGLLARQTDLLDGDGFLGPHQVAQVLAGFRFVAAFGHACPDGVTLADGCVEGGDFGLERPGLMDKRTERIGLGSRLVLHCTNGRRVNDSSDFRCYASDRGTVSGDGSPCPSRVRTGRAPCRSVRVRATAIAPLR